MTSVPRPFASPSAQGLLRTLFDLGRPTTVGELVARCNPRPATSSEADLARWREREQDLHRAVSELHEAGMVTRQVEKREGRVAHVLWLP
ncbi:hypothetical protein [Klenkia taihuensis]|uniref:Uncharacterized protein n=1 Tax=Klenkia taihuensis TaxID=1225127 RepID=A0A1I1SNK1_9ACTN|nr:hypothetical protein [Klenkia taihuensis]GHE13435.1 hypothetical protein GCM10011381_35690 [Klenkia taihuensis]SFD45463.1 hypothetical protein SAMN05661030_3400 [Klenkia taihuensis]